MTIGGNPAPQAASNARAYALLTFTALCWGGNAVLGKMAVGEISPMALVSARWLGASLLLALFAREHLRRDWRALSARLPFVAAMGMLGFTIFNALFYVAAHFTTAVNIGILQGSMPGFVLVGAFLAYRTRVGALQMSGVALTMLGVVIVAAAGDPARLASFAINFGDVLMLIACTLYAGYTVGLRRRPGISPLSLLTGLAAAAFLTSLPLVSAEIALGRFQWPTSTGWVIVVLVSLFPSFLGQLFFIHGVAMIGPGRAGVFINLVPVFASILAVALLGERFEVYHAVALTLVLGGIWLSERGKPA